MGNELDFEGKKYISARRASEISGYNSDYIGQLCRKGSLDCRLVGRSWFVNEISLREHKDVASKTPRGRIPILENRAASGEKSDKTTFAHKAEIPKTAAIQKGVTRPVVSEFATGVQKEPESFDDSYLSFRSHEHQEFSYDVASGDNGSNFAKKIFAVCAIVLIFIFSAPYFLKSISSDSKFVVIPDEGIELVNEIKILASPYLSSANALFAEVHESILFGNSLGAFFEGKLREFAFETYQTILALPDTIFDTAKNMKRIVMGEPRQTKENFASDELLGTDSENRAGITVVLSTGDKEKDEKLKQYIKDSFSGETNVLPDDTGESGIIKPVFKEQNDQDYLYVIVPVKE